MAPKVVEVMWCHMAVTRALSDWPSLRRQTMTTAPVRAEAQPQDTPAGSCLRAAPEVGSYAALLAVLQRVLWWQPGGQALAASCLSCDKESAPRSASLHGSIVCVGLTKSTHTHRGSGLGPMRGHRQSPGTAAWTPG